LKNNKKLKMHLKTTLYALCFIFISIDMTAQTSLTDAYFPSANDSLQTAFALPQYTRSLRLTPASSTAQRWDLSFLRAALNSTAKTTERFVAATDTGLLRQFPSAKLMQDIGGGQLAAYNKSTTRFDLLGYKNINLGAIQLPLVAKFLQPVLERRAPLAYNTTNRVQSNFVVAIPTDIIPDTLLSLLPIRPDSIRVRFQTDRQDKTDAFGTLLIPGGSYEVLRERRYEVTETKIEAKLNPLPWIDITALILTGQQRPRDTTIRYYFWNNLSKEPIAVLTTDATDSIVTAQYKYLKINTSVKNAVYTEGSPSLSIFPNPTSSDVFFDVKMSHAKSGFVLKISDNLGRFLIQLPMKNEPEQRVRVDVSQFSNGIYRACLVDGNGNLCTAQSFVKN
jgi:hypothetical protein